MSVAGETLSWSELAGKADALGARISGAPAIAVCGEATIDTVIAVVAGLRAGVPVVPVPADAGPMERDHILRDSGATIVIGDPDWPEVELERIPVRSPGGLAGRLGSDGGRRPGTDHVHVGHHRAAEGRRDPARAIAAGLDGLADAWGWTPDDTLAHGLPLFHVHGLILGVLGALRVGSKLVHTGRPTPERYAAAGGTLYFGVPTVWGRVAASPSMRRRCRRPGCSCRGAPLCLCRCSTCCVN